MNVIKVAFVNFWEGYDFNKGVFLTLLKKHFNVVIDNDKPDFVIASCFGDIKEVLKYKCPRIFYSGEPYTPDFSLFDYVIGSDFITILDKNGKNRYFRFPVAFTEWHFSYAQCISNHITDEEASLLLANKNKFCNFVFGHDTVDNKRKEIFDLLNTYKKVDSLGLYLNNTKDNSFVSYSPEKIITQEKYKFTIVYESMQFPGFVTEKIVHAFAAHTIPIYYGDPLIDNTFNPDSFIDARKYTNSELLEIIKKIDSNNSLYKHYLVQQKYATEGYFRELVKGLEDFLYYIFSQKPESALRRQNQYAAILYEKYLLNRPVIKKTFLQRLKNFLKLKY